MPEIRNRSINKQSHARNIVTPYVSGSTGDVYLQSSGASDDDTETDPLNPKATAHHHEPIAVDNLWNYVRERRNPKSDGFKSEYDVRAA